MIGHQYPWMSCSLYCFICRRGASLSPPTLLCPSVWLCLNIYHKSLQKLCAQISDYVLRGKKCVFPYVFQLRTVWMAWAWAALSDQEIEAKLRLAEQLDWGSLCLWGWKAATAQREGSRPFYVGEHIFILLQPLFGWLSQQLNEGPGDIKEIAKL